MKKAIIFILIVAIVMLFTPAMMYAEGKGPKDKATGEIWMSGPSQHMIFNAHDYGEASLDKGQVEYWNYDYPGPLHYTTSVLSVKVGGSGEARFMFQIPEGWPGLSGLYVVCAVWDLGTPGTNGDIYGHTATSDYTTALGWCENGVSVGLYPITGGNLVVHTYN